MLCYLTIACLTLSLFFVTDREFASGLYNKIAQLIEGKTGCRYVRYNMLIQIL